MSILPSIIFNSLILSRPFRQITADLLERFSWDMLTSATPGTIRLIINAAVTLLFLSIVSLLKKYGILLNQHLPYRIAPAF